MSTDGDWDLDGLDPDGPSARDLERFGGETVECPNCKAEVWDQAESCHRCGEWLGPRVDDGPGGRSRAAMLIILLLIGVLGTALLFW